MACCSSIVTKTNPTLLSWQLLGSVCAEEACCLPRVGSAIAQCWSPVLLMLMFVLVLVLASVFQYIQSGVCPCVYLEGCYRRVTGLCVFCILCALYISCLKCRCGVVESF
jgi:hypothetical protein